MFQENLLGDQLQPHRIFQTPSSQTYAIVNFSDQSNANDCNFFDYPIGDGLKVQKKKTEL